LFPGEGDEELADWRAGRNAVYQLAALTRASRSPMHRAAKLRPGLLQSATRHCGFPRKSVDAVAGAGGLDEEMPIQYPGATAGAIYWRRRRIEPSQEHDRAIRPSS
jgi:hypothetical protein